VGGDFWIHDSQRKQLDVVIFAFDFKFPDNHYRRGKYFALGFMIFRIVIKFADWHQLGLGFS